MAYVFGGQQSFMQVHADELPVEGRCHDRQEQVSIDLGCNGLGQCNDIDLGALQLTSELWAKNTSAADGLWTHIGGGPSADSESFASASHSSNVYDNAAITARVRGHYGGSEIATCRSSGGWPRARARASAWSLRRPAGAGSGRKIEALMFSGLTTKPCVVGDTTTYDVFSPPNDLWGFSSADNCWVFMGGSQAWINMVSPTQAQQPCSPEPCDAVSYLDAVTKGSFAESWSSGVGGSSSPVPWPFGRHDSQTWSMREGDTSKLFLFSGRVRIGVTSSFAEDPSYHNPVNNPNNPADGRHDVVINDFWSLSDDPELGWAWLQIFSGCKDTPRVAPAPRTGAATWVNRPAGTDAASGDVAWVFGGVGHPAPPIGMGDPTSCLLVDIQADVQTQVGVRSLCDLWQYVDRDWSLQAACSSSSYASGSGRTAAPWYLGQPSVTDVTPSYLGTAWTDSAQNLWLFSGADCEPGVYMAACLTDSPGAPRELGATEADCGTELWRFAPDSRQWAQMPQPTGQAASSWPDKGRCGATAVDLGGDQFGLIGGQATLEREAWKPLTSAATTELLVNV